MDLHGIVSGAIGAVNPLVPATVQISSGSVVGPSGKRTPTYDTPGELVGSIAALVLTVTAVTAGRLSIGQTVVGAVSGTKIVSLGSGTGGVGTYLVNKTQTLTSRVLTTTLSVPAQVQAMTFKDLEQVDGLNLNGTRRSIYFEGKLDGIVRSENKGGDLITLSDGPNAGTWLVAMVLEQWPDWVKVAVTLQQDP